MDYHNYRVVKGIKTKKKPIFDIKYCSRCCMPETEEEYNDDEYGMCRICRSSEQKMHIDWIKKRKLLEITLKEYKKTAGDNYDCIVPISGGKDSTFQLHVLTKILNIKPLAVTYSHNWYSKTGWYNLMLSLKTFNVDHIMFTPNRNLVNRIAKKSLGMIGDPCWSCHAGVGAFPIHVAIKFKVPLIIYGESSAETTQRADYTNLSNHGKNYFTKISAKKTPEEMTCKYISQRDLHMHQLPTDEEYEKTKVKILHLGNYFFWDDERQMEFVRDTYGWKETDIENTYKKYKSAECIMPGLHDFTCYLKRGWGRATFHASLDVRNGILSRDEGFQLINSIDPRRPEVLDYYLEITGMSEKEFYETISKHREPQLKNKIIPIIPKAHKNKEKLTPFPVQFIERSWKNEAVEMFNLKDLCFNCGLELTNKDSNCENCLNNRALLSDLKKYFEKLSKFSQNNYDCIVPLDSSWESVYLLHLIRKIYNLKPLVITFDIFHFSEMGWYNVVNSLETFHVDQVIFSPNFSLSNRLKTSSSSKFINDNYFFCLGLFSFMIKVSHAFNIPNIIEFHSILPHLLQRNNSKNLKIRKVDYNGLKSSLGQLTKLNICNRDINLFNVKDLNKKSAEKINIIYAPDFLLFNNTAKKFVKKYYNWQDNQGPCELSFANKFISENISKVKPKYLIKKPQNKININSVTKSDISHLSAKEMVLGYMNKKFSPLDVAKSVIKNIEETENSVHAWEYFDPSMYLKLAKNCEVEIQKNGVTKIIQGVPVGVKDIFNTIDYPTQMGSPLWKRFTPGNDSRVVFNMKRAGGIICGKTVTSEFAVHALNKTLNPHNRFHTPGTSSSGSAVAVATGMVPIALGTQSGASIIRPASFCGVYGFKPSFGLVPRTGILKTTDTLDTVGYFVRYLEDLNIVFDIIRLHGLNYPKSSEGTYESIEKLSKIKTWKIAFVKTHTWQFAEEYAKIEILDWINKITNISNVKVKEVELPSDMEKCHEIHSIIYDHCLSYYFKKEFENRNDLSERLISQIEHGNKVTINQYYKAIENQNKLSIIMNKFFDNFDIIICLSTSGSAPVRGTIENIDPGLMWTLTNLPALNIPLFSCPNNLPFGLQICTKRYWDLIILHFADQLVNNNLIPAKNNPSCKY